MSKVIPFCSSSKGNSVYIGNKSSGILIDAGCSFKRLRCFMEINGVNIETVKAVLITHGHSDHIKGLKQLTKQTGIPVYASKGTINEIIGGDSIALNSEIFDLTELKNIPFDFSVRAFRTSHDSAESVGFTLTDEKNNYKIGYCTDTGTVTDEVSENLIGSDLVFLESNYEPSLLRANVNYPAYLKRRIASETGHLSNQDCSEFLKRLAAHGTVRFILGHLSEENNTPETAYKRAKNALSSCGMTEGKDYTLNVAPVSSMGSTVAI